MARHRLTNEKGAVQVGFHQGMPITLGEFVQGAANLDARVVDQNVHCTGGFQRLNTLSHRVGIGDIKQRRAN